MRKILQTFDFFSFSSTIYTRTACIIDEKNARSNNSFSHRNPLSFVSTTHEAGPACFAPKPELCIHRVSRNTAPLLRMSELANR